MILSVPQETSGDALTAVNTVVQRRDGPRRLRDYDDDDGDDDGESYKYSLFTYLQTTKSTVPLADTICRPIDIILNIL